MVAARDAGTRPLWDCIYRTAHWDVVHSYNTSLPGWLVLVARRHLAAVAEMSDAEAVELGLLMRRVSAALHAATGCTKTYVMQFAESAEHPHVHVHIVPRMPDMPAERRSVGAIAYLGVSPEERVSEERMNGLAAEVRRLLAEMDRSEGKPWGAPTGG